MKTLLRLLAMAALAFGQTANPQRFSASEIRYEGDIAHLRGNVLMKIPGAIIHTDDADFDAYRYIITIHGDSRWNLLQVRSSPDFNLDSSDPRPITDPARLSAVEIRRSSENTRLHGSVVMKMPGMTIYAEDADFNQATTTIAIRGDSRLVFMKARVEPDDHLGPLRLEK